jgi:hypothetical protein
MSNDSISSVHIIGSKSLGGAERFMGRLVNALAADGDKVHAIIRNQHIDPVLNHDIARSHIKMRTMWDPIAKYQIRQRIDQLQPQIVQTYMGRATRLTHVDKKSGIKHISRLGGYYKLKGYGHADAWVGNTKGLCDYLLQNGLPADKVFYISNFADPAQTFDQQQLLDLRQQLDVPEDAWLLMSFGRFVGFKGFNVLLDAIAKLPDSIDGRPVRSVIVGDGPLKPDLLAQARQLKIEHKIVWAGWQSRPAAYYALADMVVFPSNDEETLGNVILEAWAYQKPLLTTRSRGGRELSEHQVSAWQVDCGDSAAMAQAITEMLQDSHLCQSLVAGGDQRLQQNYSQQAILAAYHQLYDHLLA